jgi:hypothetical protein
MSELGVEAVTGFRTAGGVVHPNSEAAINHQRELMGSVRSTRVNTLVEDTITNVEGNRYYESDFNCVALTTPSIVKWLLKNREAVLEALK